MSKTTITVVSSDRAHLHDIAGMLQPDSIFGDVSTIHGDARELSGLIQAPDVLILNGVAPEEGGLDVLARLGQQHPNTAFIVVSDNQAPDFLLRAMRAGVREVLPQPVAREQLREAVLRVRPKQLPIPRPDGKVLAFISCKGGSGATFLASNLAFALAAQHNKKIALIDLNLQFGDAALFVSDQVPATNLAEVAQQIHRIDASFLAASMLEVLPNFGVLAAPEDPAHAVDVKAQHVELIITLARQHYDFVIVDLGRSLDAVTLKALDIADTVYPVLQLTLPFIRDGKRLLNVLRSLDYPKSKIQLIVNRYEKNSEIQVSDLEATIGIKIARTIPNQYESVAASVNQGIPIAKLARGSSVSKALFEMAHMLAGESNHAAKGWLSRFLHRDQ